MKKIYFVLFLSIIPLLSNGQNSSEDNVNTLVTANFYHYYEETPKRPLLKFSDKGILTKINPITYISAGLLFFYQRLISEQIQADCLYEISCSSYTKFQIEKNGFRGFLLGFHQVSNCLPSALHDCSKHSLNKDEKIINPILKIGK